MQLGIVRKGTCEPGRKIWELQGNPGSNCIANISKAVRVAGHELDSERRPRRCRESLRMGTERLTLLHDVRDPLEGHLQARSARRSLTGLFACPPSTETSRDRDRDGNPPWNIPPLPLHRQSVPQTER